MSYDLLKERADFIAKVGWGYWLEQPIWIPVHADDPKRTQGYVFHSAECDKRHQDGRAEERASRKKGSHPGCERLFTSAMPYVELYRLALNYPELQITSSLDFSRPIYWDSTLNTELMVIDLDRTADRGYVFHPIAKQFLGFLRDNCSESLIWERTLTPGNYHAFIRVKGDHKPIPNLMVKLVDPDRGRKRWKRIPLVEFRYNSGSYIYPTLDFIRKGAYSELKPVDLTILRDLAEDLRGPDGIENWSI